MNRILPIVAILATGGIAVLAEAPPIADASGIEFYEKHVRPLLAENCFQCHGPEKQRGKLRLDSLGAILKGGESGPALVPGDPDKSLLIKAVRYTDEMLRMPLKKGKLKDAQIDNLVAWVKMGAPGPKDDGPKASGNVFDLAERRRHWAYQPVRPLALPAVKAPAWCTSPIDNFILAKLEATGLSPAAPADKRTLLRRVTFDLIGLPPTPAEVEAFLADDSPEAYAKVVDRLLASPHYGERWARHWLDLVRFSETMGYEFDFELFNAWRYRDYVIRAFNEDVPYDRFVMEHIAGDLLRSPRRHLTDGYNESILGTGFYCLGEGKQTPIDVRQEQMDRIDTLIDVLGKTFLAQTLACARCHDHKFDAISTKDYYALAGYLESSRPQHAFLDPPQRIAAKTEKLGTLKAEIRTAAMAAAATGWHEQAAKVGKYLLASRKVLSAKPEARRSLEDAAKDYDLDTSRLEQWIKALRQKDTQSAEHPLHAWAELAAIDDPKQFKIHRQALQNTVQKKVDQSRQAFDQSVLFDDFRRPTYEGWFVTGDAFGARPSRTGDIVLGDSPDKPIARIIPGGGAHSGLLSNRLEGELRSRTFIIDKNFIHYRMAGRGSRINLIVDGYTLIRKPIYGGLTIEVNDDKPAWQTMDVGLWKGHQAYIEIIDSSVPTLKESPSKDGEHFNPASKDGYIVVEQIRFSDVSAAPADRNRLCLEVSGHAQAGTIEGLAEQYQAQVQQTLDHLLAGRMAKSPDRFDGVGLLNWLLENDLLTSGARPLVEGKDTAPALKSIAELLKQFRRLESTLPEPLRAPAFADGTGRDEFVFIRGNHNTLGERAPRQLPEIIAGPDQTAPSQGSGRLELAKGLVSPTNPLFARVMVNRIWQHHFDEGIVRTPDDFGRMGQPPTHPELLDYLANDFVRKGWSIKAMHRLMVLSSTYRMSSQADPKIEPLDPENKLLHRMPIHRLEAEAIRDAMLAVSGRLDRRMYGPGVLPYLTPFMEGRGRPRSGPLDGEGRRSIYINVRRNFLTPMLLAFDYPTSFTTMGRRSVSNVPAQALTLMNDPFIVNQAQRWGQRVLSDKGKTTDQRIDEIYQTAFSRPPSMAELKSVREFLQGQSMRYDGGLDDPSVWADLCHVLMNVKEFIFIN